MIAANEPRVFTPLGRGHLALHPGNVYLQEEVTPAVPTACGLDFSQDLLRALQGVTIKEQPEKEGWILKESPEGGEDEFYFNGKIVIWSRSSGFGLQNVYKTFTLDSSVSQVLWTDFNLCNKKPRRLSSSIKHEEEDRNQSVTSGLCAIQANSVSVFVKSGEDYFAEIPFLISKTWSMRYGLLLERNAFGVSQKRESNAPVIFSMFHPLDEVSPVIKEVNNKLSYFCNPCEKIVFVNIEPPLAVTFSKTDGVHRIWRLQTTVFDEAEYACSRTLIDSQLRGKSPTSEVSSTPLRTTSCTPRTPSNVCSPFLSYASSRVASPSLSQSSSMSPVVSNRPHMATLSRTCSPSVNAAALKRYSFTPQLCDNSQQSVRSVDEQVGASEFMDPLAPDLCFHHMWSEKQGLNGHPEAASKIFLFKDCTGHDYICFLLPKHQKLKLIQYEKKSDDTAWVFGISTSIPAIDAEVLPSLNFLLTLEINFTLSLYTGFVKISKVFVSEIFSPFIDIPSDNSQQDNIEFGTPRRCSLVTSTRPTTPQNVKFSDEVISPVSSSEFGRSRQLVGTFRGLKDAVANRVNLETANGIFRLSLPELANSTTVISCLDALRALLPHDVYTCIFVQWYCCRNAPGPSDMTCQAEIYTFLICLLSAIGYDVEDVTLGGYNNPDFSGSSDVSKKQKLTETGCDEDWQYLLSSNFHNSVFLANNANWIGLEKLDNKRTNFPKQKGTINVSKKIWPYMGHILYGLHLVYEDCKLSALTSSDLPLLASFLFELSRDLRLEKYMDLYWRDHPKQFESVSLTPLLLDENFQKVLLPSCFSHTPPCIYTWIINAFQYSNPDAFPYIPNVTQSLKTIVLTYVLLLEPELSFHEAEKYLTSITLGTSTSEDPSMLTLNNYFIPMSDSKKAAITFLSKLRLREDDVSILPVAVALAIRNALVYCRLNPSSEWQEDTFNLIGRQDLLMLHLNEKGKKISFSYKSTNSYEAIRQGLAKDGDDGFQFMDVDVLMLRFSKDLRICDICHMLQSSKPVRISVQQRPEVSDHEFIEEQERHLYSLCIRTMALPVGRGMLTLQSYSPVVTETLPIPKLCLTGRAPPRNATIDLSHIDIPPNMNMWPLFHNGVAAGLRISLGSDQIDSTWMVYNKPRSSGNDTPTEHAGFLMALGLNGHLSNLTTMSVHDYLCKGHELTSVGVLLGIAAAKRGTMDLGVTKMLSIHIEALLPLHSTELDVPPVVQVAAVMSIGLLYQGSGNHHMAEVMLDEIGRPPGPEMEHCVDRESYSLAAGLSLGLITFGKGNNVSGLTDLPMADQLYRFMVGGHKRPLTGVHKEKHKSPSYQIREGDCVNVDVTSPGATLALGMMFFDSDNQSIADWMTAPDTQFLLDMVRPDFLLLRTVSKGLILWSSVCPSKMWVEEHVPEIVAKHAFKRGVTNANVDYETMSQAYCNIIAGCCLCLGLKFAGSSNDEAFTTLMHYAKFFLSLTRKSAGEQAGRSTIETCLNVSVLALAMVMAGTGDLEVLRLCRHLRSRVNQISSYVLYGSHLATHMALGLLFLGGGRFTLSTSPLAIGAMLCAFYPKFPTHSNDNRYHLQALYHLYVLATEPRLIIPRLLTSMQPVYTHISVMFKDTPWYRNMKYKVKAPCLLPELKFLQQVVIDDPRYWPVVFDCEKNWEVLNNLLKNGGNIFLKQKAGCLPYTEDPQGFRSLMAQSYITSSVHDWNLKNCSVSKFSCDPLALHFSDTFLQAATVENDEKIWQQKICSFLFECASQEKMDVLPVYISLIQMEDEACSNSQSSNWLQFKLLDIFNIIENTNSKPLLRPEFVSAICRSIEKKLHNEVQGDKEIVVAYMNNGFNKSITSEKIKNSAIVGFMQYFQVLPNDANKRTFDISNIPNVLLSNQNGATPNILQLNYCLSH